MGKLGRALERACDKSLAKCTPEDFIKCFPPSVLGNTQERAERERILQQAHTRLVKAIDANIKEEFASICARWEVPEKLLVLDQWAEQEEQKDIKMRSLQPLKISPMKMALGVEAELKTKERDMLRQALQQLEEENNRLKEDLLAKREETQFLAAQFEAAARQLAKASAEAREWNKSEARQWMDAETTSTS